MNKDKFRPMLAVACEDVGTIKYPVLASLKLDGIRCVVLKGVVYSRTMKPIPSKTVQELFGKPEYEGFDGELIYGDVYDEKVFNLSTSFCMSKGIPTGLNPLEIRFYVFDLVSEEGHIDRLHSLSQKQIGRNVVLHLPTTVQSPEQLTEFEESALSKGGEGVMVRSMNGPYKQGRSTLKEGYLLKIKRFVDEEATIIGFDEKMHNTNESKVDALGYTERSSSKDGMIGADTLGAIVVQSEKWGVFRIGTGFDDSLRKEIWGNKDKYLGELVKFKYFATGVVEKPRFPVYLGIRDKMDV